MSVDAYRIRYAWGGLSSHRQRSASNWAGGVARLISPMFAAISEGEDPACLLFWYHMHGTEVGELKVYVRNETSQGLGNPVWALGGERGNVWRAAEIRVEQPLDFQVVFEFVAGNFENMAIDDVSLSRYECPGEHPVASEPSVNCDFSEAEICYYNQDENSRLKWLWTNRATDSRFTGPATDHTRGDELGFYLHIDSEFQQPGSVARISTPLIDAQESPSCFEFWYHMYGSHIGRLSVYAKFNDSELRATPSWTLSGNQGNAWHRTSFTVANMTRKFVMVFEGVLGIDYRTDIAIDDVQYYPNTQCPEYTTPVPPLTTLPAGIPLYLDCDFEADNCNFSQAVDDVMDWARVRASYLQENINGYMYRYAFRTRFPSWNRLKGPNGDHTLQTQDGSFFAFWYQWSWNRYTVGDMRLDDRTRVISPLLAASDLPRCLTFYMYKEGSQNGFLNVFVREYGETRSVDPIFAYFWRTGKQWWRIRVDIPPSARPFNIIFEAVLPGGIPRSFMVFAIDDVTVVAGKCELNQGIPASCDFEDEDQCGYMDWSGRWFRTSGRTPSKDTGPSADHTLGDANGHYMYYETSQPNRPNQYSNLYSPRMHFSGKQCLRFYYHASGNDTRRLEAYLREPAQYTMDRLWQVEGKQKDAWLPVNVDLAAEGDFQIVFRAYSGRGFRGDIAVDDVIILPHPCIDLPTESSCNFELGPDKCGFANSAQNDVDWLWYDAIFGRHFPLASQSTATNSFMYLKWSLSSPKRQSSEFYSGHLAVSPGAGDLCLSFEYTIGGDATQTTSVYVEEKGGSRRLLGSLSDRAMSSWKMRTWPLLSSNALRPFVVYRIVFLVTMAPADGAVIGIDNVVVSSDTCRSLGFTSKPEGPQARTAGGNNRSGMAAGLTIFVIIIVVALCVAVFVFRGRIQSMIRRCTQRVTEMNYKRHDVGFVKDDKKESVEIPSIVHQNLEERFESCGASSVEGANSQSNI